MIWITQAIIVIFFGKDILHKSWINVILCFEYFYRKQLQIALMYSQGFIYRITESEDDRLLLYTCSLVLNLRGYDRE